MGKHNGKARTSGVRVGAALTKQARREGKGGKTMVSNAFIHTTDPDSTAVNTQSVLENNDLTELMSMAELADKDFAAERGHQVIVISTGPSAATAKDRERDAVQRVATQAKHQHRLRVPRRPDWDSRMAPDILDKQERAAFLEWRRDLARLEEDEGLVLTPFEKNLEVWRQLWRVLERSDIVVQVLDARDPLRYRSEDLEAYARELHPSKASLMLLNKADLLPAPLRSAWADHFDAAGIDYVFWSAKTAIDGLAGPAQSVAGHMERDERARVLSIDQLLAVFKARAQAAVEARLGRDGSAECAVQSEAGPRRLMVGLTGYPNVGKSSTINALFGSKKTAVAPTPGKTKHFQTLNVTERLTLCDCPGLVLPRYAASKAEMVAAGVIPIDRLTDVRAPVEVVTQRVSREQLERVYGFRLPKPEAEDDAPGRAPTAAEVLRSHALSKGWVVGSGLPDETRSGRQILKDFVAGKLLHCCPPPGCSTSSADLGLPGQVAPEQAVPAGTSGTSEAQAHSAVGLLHEAGAEAPADRSSAPAEAAEPLQPTASEAAAAAALGSSESGASSEGSEGEEADGTQEEAAAAGPPTSQVLSAADLELMQSMGLQGGNRNKPQRPDYKFNKKPKRAKARSSGNDGGGYDGAAFTTGKRGGLVRPLGQ